MVASLNSMAKTFTKLVKTFAGLLTTIVAKGRRLVLILHLEVKYEKWTTKMKSTQKKLGKEHLDYKSQLWQKSQQSKLTFGQSQWSGQRKSTVWSTQVNSLSTMTSADVVGDVSR